jgi:hypothetical protein
MNHQRQKAVRRAAGDDFERARVLQPLERAHQVAAIAIVEQTPQVIEVLAIVPRERPELRVLPRALHFLVAELAQAIEPLRVPLDQQLIAQHAHERRGQRQRDAERNAVRHAAIEDLEQRQIGLGDGFVKPILLEELRILRMPHVGEVRVQHDREPAFAHESLSRSGTWVMLHGNLPVGLEGYPPLA